MMKNLVSQIINCFQIEKDIIEEIIENSNQYYKKLAITLHGKHKTIHIPTPELKMLQYWLLFELFSNNDFFKISNNATAYQDGLSIKVNALRHQYSDIIVHFDIKDFFHSINFEKHLLPILKKYINDDKDLEYINKICFLNNNLSIGSPTSPIISNIIMKNFDEKLVEQIEQIKDITNIIYTRYADDIYISATIMNKTKIKKEDPIFKNFVDKTQDIVNNLIQKYGFQLNDKKTWCKTNNDVWNITGIFIQNQKISLGKNKKKIIKSLLHKISKTITDKNVMIPIKEYQSAQGYLAILQSIEPHTYSKYINRYSKNEINIQKYIISKIQEYFKQKK